MATKRGGRTISLRGDAARAFMEMATGKPSKNEDDELARLATIVHMSIADGNLPRAVSILKEAMALAGAQARKECLGEKPHVEQTSDATIQKA